MSEPWRRRDNSYLIGNKFACGAKPNKTAFKAGSIPWNKGKKGMRLSRETEFKKGQPGRNWLPVGSIRIRKDKSGTPRRFIKVSEPNKWKYYAIYIWESANGPIQRGLILHHINHDSLDDELSNLALLTRAQHIAEHRNDLLKGKVTQSYEQARLI